MLGELFDPTAELQIEEHCRPHWSQSGAIAFATFRTKDSIPREVVQRWHQEKLEWFRIKGIDCSNLPNALMLLDEPDRNAFHKRFRRQREMYLDTCQGRCLLSDASLAKIVAESLMHFDRERYRMGDFVIMPNHVHLLAAFHSEETIRQQFDSWLHWTATRINRAIGERGHFWQTEPFDHLVRSPEQYEFLKDYIRENPKKASLKEGEYIYRRYQER